MPQSINMTNTFVIRRTRLNDGDLITVYITIQRPRKTDNEAVVRITALKNHKGMNVEPAIDRLTPTASIDAVKAAVKQAVSDLKAELA